MKQTGTTPAKKSNPALQTAPLYLVPFVAFMKRTMHNIGRVGIGEQNGAILFQDSKGRSVILKQVQDDGVWFRLPPLFSSFPLRLCVKQSGTTPAQKSNPALQTNPFYLVPFVAFMNLTTHDFAASGRGGARLFHAKAQRYLRCMCLKGIIILILIYH